MLFISLLFSLGGLNNRIICIISPWIKHVTGYLSHSAIDSLIVHDHVTPCTPFSKVLESLSVCLVVFQVPQPCARVGLITGTYSLTFIFLYIVFVLRTLSMVRVLMGLHLFEYLFCLTTVVVCAWSSCQLFIVTNFFIDQVVRLIWSLPHSQPVPLTMFSHNIDFEIRVFITDHTDLLVEVFIGI